ncbi:hypothetical protein OIU78_015592 [Salix suchowensis]|nr:hypothetical protein OIU78_015592 [Salix suchowensis]
MFFTSLVASGTRVVALVVDLFGTDAFDIAREFKVSPYIFYPAPAMALSLFFYLPKLDEMVSCEYRDMPEPVEIPGCLPIHGGEMLDPTQDRKNDAYKWLLYHSKRYRLADGVMVNSFVELERGALKALHEAEPGKPPVYPDIKVALRPQAGENGLIGREEIANVVRGLMEGEEGKSVRNRMKDLKDLAAEVLGEDGSSTKALAEVARKWKNQKCSQGCD